MALTITFHGGAEAVTGSNFLIKSDEGGTILVDCGLEQGKDFCEACMYDPFPYDAADIESLVITHAHLDHVGRGPKLVKEGFRGDIYMTAPTRDLTELMLRDSVGIMDMEARERGRPPLFKEEDVNLFLSLIKTVEYKEKIQTAPGIEVTLRNTGHILGSASVRIEGGDGTVLAITSDIGNSPSPLLPDAEHIKDADVVVLESVYGDRLHDKTDRVKQLTDAIQAGIDRGGAILIPAFSIERTQLMLYELSNLFESGALPKIPVFLDSPLAIAVTEVYEKWGDKYFKDAAQDEMKRENSLFKFPFLTMTPSRDESMDIDKTPNPKIIIAGAGMSHGGRIGRHEAKYLPDPATTLMIVGYQAPGSPGRLLQDGSPTVRLNGRDVRVRAKVGTFSGWSGHADRDGLLAFAEKALPKAKTFFVSLGEPAAARFLAQRIHDYLGARAIVASKDETWRISKGNVERI